jgi:hypothetical protein
MCTALRTHTARLGPTALVGLAILGSDWFTLAGLLVRLLTSLIVLLLTTAALLLAALVSLLIGLMGHELYSLV